MGVNVVPGNPTEQSSYWSELGGISGLIAVTSAVCDKYDITTWSIIFALDGKEALSKASSLWPLLSTDPDFDLLSDIRSKLRSLLIQVKWQCIEGHQDKHTLTFFSATYPKTTV